MTQTDTLRCACAQIEHRIDAPELMLKAHEEAIADAIDQSVDFLVFPEASLTGYPATLEEVQTGAIERDDPAILKLAEQCGQLTAVIGFMERGADDRVYNSLAWIGQGGVQKVHRKVNLPSYGRLREREFFSAGHQTSRVTLDSGWQVGGLICADFWDPGLAYLSALAEDSVIAVPFASTREGVGNGFSNEDGWHRICINHSLVYGMPVIACNWVGTFDSDMTFWGGSSIFDAKGNVIVEAKDGVELIIADLHHADIESARKRLPTIRDLSATLLVEEIGQLKGRDDAAK